MSVPLGQLLFIGIKGKTLLEEEARFIIENQIGGVILFGRNIESPRQVLDLTTHLHSLVAQTVDKIPLLIGVDQEGGRVARLKAPFTRWPAAAVIGRKDSTSLVYDFSFAMGRELRAVGINLDFAPCADVFTNPLNTVIGDRAFSSDPDQVAKLVSAAARGFTKAGVIACAKHFPGHGDTVIDSHDSLPVEKASLERLRSVELVPFKKLFRSRLDMVMTAHIKFPEIDTEPVTFSRRFLTEILRDDLRYRGLVVSDDLGMGALAKNYPTAEIPLRALEAGCDLLLYCNEFEHPAIALGAIGSITSERGELTKQIDLSLARIASFKAERLTSNFASSGDLSVIGCPQHQTLALSLNSH